MLLKKRKKTTLLFTFGPNKLRLSVEFNKNRFQHIKIAGYFLYFALQSLSTRRVVLIE